MIQQFWKDMRPTGTTLSTLSLLFFSPSSKCLLSSSITLSRINFWSVLVRDRKAKDTPIDLTQWRSQPRDFNPTQCIIILNTLSFWRFCILSTGSKCIIWATTLTLRSNSLELQFWNLKINFYSSINYTNTWRYNSK